MMSLIRREITSGLGSNFIGQASSDARDESDGRITKRRLGKRTRLVEEDDEEEEEAVDLIYDG